MDWNPNGIDALFCKEYFVIPEPSLAVDKPTRGTLYPLNCTDEERIRAKCSTPFWQMVYYLLEILSSRGEGLTPKNS